MRIYILVSTLAFISYGSLFGQGNTPNNQLFSIRVYDGGKSEISHYKIKADKKIFEFRTDTSQQYDKSLDALKPEWIKSIEIIRNSQLAGETISFAVITLKKNKLRKLPSDFQKKFIEYEK